ncbi:MULTISPECIES: sulfite exporter TauE/SafE family protein [Trueperella]|uniref:Probable membrane transporter protein n=1 Tax=Trueperella abortisuis TaxID=445930 RepID=A0ABT9PML5_9ACTO|nr:MULTISPECIES: sulfite exporter TauE/SafE family protein [Trueperella]MDP9833195.1 putative membrane protein YfcA [Trueperella abortisuis]MDY5402897.1 sulfite exporter TauE/SafE family protein [Trueperella sp.]
MPQSTFTRSQDSSRNPASNFKHHHIERKPLATVVLTALGTGVLTGYFRVGGSFVVVPALILAFGIPIRFVSATSLLVMALTTASWLLARIGTDLAIDWKVTLAFGITSMVGGLIDGPMSKRLPAKALSITLPTSCSWWPHSSAR